MTVRFEVKQILIAGADNCGYKTNKHYKSYKVYNYNTNIYNGAHTPIMKILGL